ncbi:MAG: DUF2797 domain-containing protein [Salinivirgaceae bacterium]|nr:DUF2797 domain-containing protein [Salinivirgaceae bacterium]
MLGHLLKLKSEHSTPIHYSLPIEDQLIPLNELMGKEIQFNYTGEIHCIHCGRKTKTSFAQGYCYPCFQTLPQTEEDVLHPEKCKAHIGIARDMEWATKNCLIDHHVYLADTSQLKVGVTRHTQVPTRWIDQGASQTISLALTPNRYLAGMIEVALKSHLADKTQWRAMLNSNEKSTNLLEQKSRIEKLIPMEYQQYINPDNTIYEFEYPFIIAPLIKKSVNLEKTPSFRGRLIGIKGQYLLFDDGFALNIRKHAGYLVEFHIFEPQNKTATLF